MTTLVLFDDARARRFEPFALTRPFGEMRVGIELVRRRWERAVGGATAGAIMAPHLEDFEEAGAPPAVRETLAAGTIIANTRCIVPLAGDPVEADRWTVGGRVAAVRLATALARSTLADGETPLDALPAAGTRSIELGGRWIDAPWSIIAQLLDQLREDILAVAPTTESSLPAGASVIGAHPVLVEPGAIVEPYVVFDATAGPILVRGGATVRAFTRLVGPCFIASTAIILGDRVHGCAIGEMSVVRGEISETVVLGHANKAHDGFVGHSILGRWVNLGAGTITSNLKNTYGTVQMWTPEGMRDTELLKLGTFFGDHVKTGIGTRLTTGTVVGAGSNIYGSTMPLKAVPPFSWGEGNELSMYRLDRFLEIAARAMRRRDVPLGPGTRRTLAAAHARSWPIEGSAR